MKLDLHIHTKKSCDCRSEISEVVAKAEEAGLDAIAIADHGNMAAVDKAKQCSQNVTIIPAMEITARGGTHIIGLFLEQEIISKELTDIIDEVHLQDGLVLIPHPFRPGTGLFYNREKMNMYSGEEMSRIIRGIDLIESLNYQCSPHALIETDRFLALHPDIPRTAGSDAHRIEEIGRAYIEFEDFHTTDLNEIKEALLTRPRIFRYEAYTIEREEIARTAVIKQENRSLIFKTKQFVGDSIVRPLQEFYRSSIARLKNEKEESVKERE